MDSETKMYALFGHLKVLHGDDLKWSRIRSRKAAFPKWHARSGDHFVFAIWTPKMRTFWHELEKRCKHSNMGKQQTRGFRAGDSITHVIGLRQGYSAHRPP